jgi:imidazolonepropionase-like amidohydrolase
MFIRALLAISAALFPVNLGLSQPSHPTTLVIRDVTVIDCTGNAPQPRMSLLISGGKIIAIKPASKLTPPENTEILDGRGKFLIPGLWNMHVHLGNYENGKKELAGHLAQGVTGVRDMGSPLDDILRLRKETSDGTIVGPSMVVAGPIVQGPLPFQMPLFIAVKDATSARQTVDMLHSRGVDFIKVQDAIPNDIYVAVAEQSRKDNIPYAGHIAPTVLSEEASDLGQRSIEHLGGRFWGLLVASSKDEAELHTEEVQMYSEILAALDQHKPPSPTNMRSAFTQRLVESYDPDRAAALMTRFKHNDTWQCPTLVALHTLWADGETTYSPEDLRWADRLLARESAFIPMMQKYGIGLLAGTDLPPGAKGGTIHDELAALVDAGLTPLQALQTATINPAKFLNKSGTLGSIETGKIANLVLLDADPLADIHSTQRISAVILKGRIVSHIP